MLTEVERRKLGLSGQLLRNVSVPVVCEKKDFVTRLEISPVAQDLGNVQDIFIYCFVL